MLTDNLVVNVFSFASGGLCYITRFHFYNMKTTTICYLRHILNILNSCAAYYPETNEMNKFK